MDGCNLAGERTGNEPAASFRCAECGVMAAVVKVVRKGGDTGIGPPPGREASDRDAIVVDCFLGTHAMSADAETADAIQAILGTDTPDPSALRQAGWEIAPFWCPDCGLSYCTADWRPFPVFDDGFYDRTIGICPNSHRHTIDD